MDLIFIFLGFLLINCASVSEVIGCSSHVGILRLAAGKVANYFSSPGKENCTWLIIASNPTEVVRIDFEDTEAEDDLACALGGIAIYDGSTFDTKKLGINCGDTSVAYESSGRYMLISLEKNISSHGFRAKYYMFSNNVTTSNVASIVGGIIGTLILLSLGTTIVCTLKTHHMIPSILPSQREKDKHNNKINREHVSNQNVPKVSVVVPSSDYVQPINYPAALQTPGSRFTHSYPTNPSQSAESLPNHYSTFLANKTFTSTRSILSPGGYISAQSSSFENFD